MGRRKGNLSLTWVILFVFVGGCCTTIAPPEDFPEIPLPEKTILLPVNGVRETDGIFLSDEEYQKALKNVKQLEGERNALRNVIREYNEWAGKEE